MNIALVGPTCAGKTTCASKLCETYRLRHLSTGQVLRENRARQTALGILTRRYVEMGELVPDEIINAMIEEAVRKTPADQGLLFDGFPVTPYQARFLEELFRAVDRTLDGVIFMNIPEKVVFNRASKRLPHRPDDRKETIHNRLRVFQRTTSSTLTLYRQGQKLIYLDATGTVTEVCQKLSAILNQIRDGKSTHIPTQEENALLDQLLAGHTVDKVKSAQPSLDIVIMGAPGSGKGTRAAYLAEYMNIPHIATGDLFRENLASDTILGKIAKNYIDRGELVPDDVTEAMVKERLGRRDTHEGFILDGFPRNISQAEALDEIMAEMSRKLDSVIYISVPDEELVQRVSGRRLCPVCQASYHIDFNPPKNANRCDRDDSPLYQREDDDADTVRARLRIFHGQTMQVIEHYRNEGILREVSSNGDMQQVKQDMQNLVNSIKRR